MILAVGGPPLRTQMTAGGSRVAHLAAFDTLAAVVAVRPGPPAAR